MNKAKNILVISLLFSGIVVASEVEDLGVSASLAELAVAHAAEGAELLDGASQEAVVAVTHGIGQVLRAASKPNDPYSVLRAARNERAAAGLSRDVLVASLTQAQIDQANRAQAEKDAVKNAMRRGYGSGYSGGTTTTYLRRK